jgi:molybdenum cofactor guanylyltransferase
MSEIVFHPYELGFCGYSGSGKTTLITNLIESLKAEYSISYLKNDQHRFEMDHVGKDTFKAWRAGASQVYISDPAHWATIKRSGPDLIERRTAFLQTDIALIEGHKTLPIEKILVIDPARTIFEKVKTGEIANILAFVGPERHFLGGDLNAPYFCRDEIENLSRFVKETLRARSKRRPLNGLVLTGGFSKRMKGDKALIRYDAQGAKPQAQVTFDLLARFCSKTFISARPGQWSGQEIGYLPQIEDAFSGMGPLGGILSAMHSSPDAAWLVVACDLPFLNQSTVEYLLKHRNPFKFASCFQSQNGDFPEPLCTVYEPKILNCFHQFLALGYRCPRKVLVNSDVKLLQQPQEHALQNVNTRDEYAKALRDIREMNLS